MMIFSVILAQSLLYPAVADLYQQGKPLTGETCCVPDAQVYVTDQRLSAQKRFYTRMPSPALRSDMAHYFGKSRNAKAATILLELLAREKNDLVRCDLIAALIQLKKSKISYALPADFSKYFTAEDSSVALREYAMKLYAMFYPEKAPGPVLKTILRDPQDYLLDTAYCILKDRSHLLDEKDLLSLYRQGLRKGSGGRLHCISAALLSGRKPTAQTTALLQKDLARKGLENLHRHIALAAAQNPAADMETLQRCTASVYPSVRSAASDMKELTAGKIKLLFTLAKDDSFFVRETALLTLGREPEKVRKNAALRAEVIRTLIQAFRDPVRQVRQAAGKALSNYKLTQAEKTRLLSSGSSFVPAREDLIDYALRNREKSFTPAITGFLGSFRESVLICKAVHVLGELKYVPSLDAVMKQSSAKDPKIRRECAAALGKLNVRRSYAVLKKLLRDKDPTVSTQAAKSMFLIGDKVFTSDFAWVLRSRTSERADQRSIAVRFLGFKAISLSARIWQDLTTLLLKECIIEPMSPPVYDHATVRISILFLLHEKAQKKDPKAAELLKKALAELPAKNKEGMEDELFKEYLNQFLAFHAGKKAVPGRIQNIDPLSAVNVFDKK